jgi:hypothetical protein
MSKCWLACAFVCLILLVSSCNQPTTQANAQPGPRREGKDRGGGRNRPLREMALPPEVAVNKAMSVVLGCPTDHSIVFGFLSDNERTGNLYYAKEGDELIQTGGDISFHSGESIEIELASLSPDQEYSYKLNYRLKEDASQSGVIEGSFHTQRAPGSTFTFEIQGDSHPERQGKQFGPMLYAQTLRAAAADKPDFYMTIGDDFSVDALQTVNADTVKDVYLNQRYYLSIVGETAPIFLVNGNHEQAAMCNLDGTADNVAVWAGTSRNAYFSEPAPDAFYTGDKEKIEHIGLLRDYYAWTWGDALFVVIEPYWHSPKAVDNPFGVGQRTRDLWEVTLGDAQYQWFKDTLEHSNAKYKFVFTHHVLGTGRGGVELADYYEWGGKSQNGQWEFDAKRQGWELPIQQLMVKNGVTIFFQGHDHLFAKQELDGVVYQTLPCPADPNYAMDNAQAYQEGDKLPCSGRVRVTVSPAKVTVDYIRSYRPEDETAEHKSGEIAYSYTITGGK